MEHVETHEIHSQPGRGKNKRAWTKEEDAALVLSLLEIVDTHKTENGFRSGHLQKLEAMMAEKGHSTIQGNPHIVSRMKILKRDYGLYSELLNSNNISGFGYDSTTGLLTADEAVWIEFLKIQSNSKFKIIRKKAFPHYEDLHVIFGNDRANGNVAMNFTEMADVADVEDIDGTMDNQSHSGPSPKAHASVPSTKRKRNATIEAMTMISSSMDKIGAKIENTATKLCAALQECNKVERQQTLMDELNKIEILTTSQRMRLVRKIGMTDQLLNIFFGLSDEDKEEFVISLEDEL